LVSLTAGLVEPTVTLMSIRWLPVDTSVMTDAFRPVPRNVWMIVAAVSKWISLLARNNLALRSLPYIVSILMNNISQSLLVNVIT